MRIPMRVRAHSVGRDLNIGGDITTETRRHRVPSP
jgi:hypothetical protein